MSVDFPLVGELEPQLLTVPSPFLSGVGNSNLEIRGTTFGVCTNGVDTRDVGVVGFGLSSVSVGVTTAFGVSDPLATEIDKVGVAIEEVTNGDKFGLGVVIKIVGVGVDATVVVGPDTGVLNVSLERSEILDTVVGVELRDDSKILLICSLTGD